MEDGSLKILKDACPNLLSDAGLSSYDNSSRSEEPIDEYNHACDALRYLISRIDARRMAIIRKSTPPDPALGEGHAPGAGLPTSPPPALGAGLPTSPPPALGAGLPTSPPPALGAGLPTSPPAPTPPPRNKKWLSVHNEQLWTRL
jgi:hypothetical protein